MVNLTGRTGMQFSRRFIPCMFFSILVLAGCAAGPDYRRPETAGPAAFREDIAPEVFEEGGVVWRSAAPSVPDGSAWWTSFADPCLDAMMEELGHANQNIQAALASLRQARAQVREARASFFPVIGAGMSRMRGADGPGPAGTLYTAQMQATWELDLWGGVRRSVEGRESLAMASAADLASIILSMRSELATQYFQLRTLDELSEFYEETIRAYTRSWRILQDQMEVGIASPADVAQAFSLLKTAEAQAKHIVLQRKRTEHAIALLLGKTPAEFHLPPAGFTARIPDIDAGMPSALLERRPDVAAAELEVAAANAEIGVAKSAFFPVFSFSATGGFVHGSSSGWFAVPNRIWSLGPSLALSLFEGGATLARTDAAVAAWERAVAQYRQTVLQAVNEVESSLAAKRLLQEEERLQEQAYASSRRAEQILWDQYKVGIVGFLHVLVAQEATLDSARALSETRGALFAATVALIRALGGGWDTSGLYETGKSLPETASRPGRENLLQERQSVN